MNNRALITGASSGIGKDLAFVHAKKKGDLVLIARREEELLKLKSELESEYKISVKVIAKDLTGQNAAKEIYDELTEENIEVNYLINNAGFGAYGKFHEIEIEKQKSMIDLNVKSLFELTHFFSQNMIKRKEGKILNVASTAGMVPGPLQAVYYGTKAFVISFSQSIAEELSDYGITVTVLCPGPVKTEFAEIANLENSFIIKFAKDSKKVAKIGYKAMMKGTLVKVNDPLLKISLRYLIPFIPRKLVLKISRKTQEQ